MRATRKPELGLIGAHHLVDAVRRDCLVELAGRVVGIGRNNGPLWLSLGPAASRYSWTSSSVPGCKRANSVARRLCGHAEMRHDFARVPETPDLELAQSLG